MQTVSTLTKNHEILYATIILAKEQIKIDTYVELGRNFFQIATKIGSHRFIISRMVKCCSRQYLAKRDQKSYEGLAKKSILNAETKREIGTTLKA